MTVRRRPPPRQQPPQEDEWEGGYEANDGEDELIEDEWPPRLPSSARRYQLTPQSAHGTALIRNTTAGQPMRGVPLHRSPIPPRRTAALQRWPPPVEFERETLSPSRRGGRPRFHWSVFLGLGMFIMILGWVALGAVGSWWQTTQDDWHYGRPRTFQVDAVVGQNNDSGTNPSHFIALNLNGHIEIIELPAGDPSKARIYGGPMLYGQGKDLTPVTLSFKDVNGDGKPDMIMWVQDSHFVFINDGGSFRPARPGEVIQL